MRRFFRKLFWVLCFFVTSVLLSVLYYGCFALLFSSDVEKTLMEENRLYGKYLPQMKENAALMDAEMEYLADRDEFIYRSVFKAEAPVVRELIDNNLDTGEDASLTAIRRAWTRSAKSFDHVNNIERCWAEIFDSLSVGGSVKPPLASPVRNLEYRNVGASVGEKLSPFYKMNMQHDGLDIVAPADTPVYAVADGTVTAVQNARGGKGNMVTITHSGGYVTRYAHLGSVSVKKGKTVKRGQMIGTVGDSGRSFTTHLHYEILKDGEPQDPIQHLFCDIDPKEYLRILVKSASSGQSMD